MTGTHLVVHVVADNTGDSAARLCRAAMAQFPGVSYTLIRHPRSGDDGGLLTIFDTISQARAQDPTQRVLVLFTLVQEQKAAMVERYCTDKGIPFANLFSDTLAAIEAASGLKADQVAMRPVAIEADYFDRISAMEYAVRNDGGVSPEALLDCDICLVGPSRTGKTPLALYLGFLGYKAANVPLVAGIEPPEELYRIDRWRIVGLTLGAEELAAIRSRRAKGLRNYGSKDGGYADLSRVYEELDEVGRTLRSLGCPVLDNTGLTMSEAADRVIEMVADRARRAGASLRRLPDTMKFRP